MATERYVVPFLWPQTVTVTVVVVATRPDMLKVRCTKAEKARWTARASSEGVSLSDLIRSLLDAPAHTTVAPERVASREPRRVRVVAREDPPVAAPAPRLKPSGCPAPHIVGVRCKFCGQVGKASER